MNNRTHQIGITGGIGSGKSLICNIFAVLGIPVYPADDRAKTLMATDPKLVGDIKSYFGEMAYLENGGLNRAYLAKKVFNEPKELAKLNQLVHPAVGEDYQRWVAGHQGKSPYLIKEAALLFESGSYQALDFVVTVFASESTRVKRVLARDPQRGTEEVKAIIDKQLPESERQKLADFIIDNDGHQLLIPQVLYLDSAFKHHSNLNSDLKNNPLPSKTYPVKSQF